MDKEKTVMNGGEPDAREAWIAQLSEALAADGRFAAAWLFGSLGRGEGDALSDIDLALVVRDEHAARLCRREAQSAGECIPERLALFSQFGQPAVIHENHNNAAAGGSFSCVMYAGSGWMVDWSLRPQKGAARPENTRVLFDHAGIPTAPPTASGAPPGQAAHGAERAAFFWMMAAITAKYLARGDRTFGLAWLGRLAEIAEELEWLNDAEASTGEWIRGAAIEELFAALRGLCARVGRLDLSGGGLAQNQVERLIERAEAARNTRR